ncbi:MAG: DUF6443 domain-containing protein [Bacteroidia bacterium]|nr:DUF6443 domain-containing protein [Bacteroidia bacterium]
MKPFYRCLSTGILLTWAVAGSLLAQSLNQNFIQTEVPQTAVKTEAALGSLSDMNERHRSVQYFDGLGRPLQTVEVKASAGGKDQVVFQIYDEFGRNPRSYLPYESTLTNGGSFRANPVSEQDTYFDLMGLIAPVDRNYPFADQVFEPSPLNRVIEQGAPGFDWQPAQGNTSKLYYRTNDLSVATDVVNRWNYNPVNGQFVAAGTYPANSLTVTEVKDNNGHSKIQYTDKAGRVVLKRIAINATSSPTNAASWMNIYSLYDHFGRLRVVLQPEGVKAALANGGNLYTGSILDNFAFSYLYDEKGRMIAQKAPGVGWIYKVYDPLDRVVLTQDGALRSQNNQFWIFTKYDHLGRPIKTGIYQNSANLTRDQLQVNIRTGCENGQLKLSEMRSASSFDLNQGYTNQAFPQTIKELYSVTWYDHYDFNLDGIPEKAYTFEPEIPGNEAFLRTTGKITGNRTWIPNRDPDMPDSMLTAIFYDDRGREIQMVAENHIGGMELLTRKYDFKGKAIRKIHRHTDANRNYAVINDFTYDHRGRELTNTQTHELDGVKDTPVILSALEYDALGRVSEKNLHSEDQGSTYTQSVDYFYNIRNWLTDINQINPNCGQTGTGEGANGEPVNVGNNDPGTLFGDDQTEDAFGMKLYHNTGFTALNTSATAQYNGNISGIEWQTPTDCIVRGYGFKYDYNDRLLDAHYAAQNATGVWNQELNRYSVNEIGYDLNGNIQKVKRKGKTGATTYGLIDDLTYTYTGNKVTKVKDKITASFASLGIDHFYDGNPTTNDYIYDGGGNITTDNNKTITVTYNLHSKPVKVQYANGNRIEFIYDGEGNKLRKKVTTASTEIEDYVQGFVYQDQELVFFAHSEGRVNFVNQSTFEYQYNLTDHLGNVRVSFRPDSVQDWVIVQEDHYYPFGMRMGGLSFQSGVENDLRFNGKERTGDLNLGWYDYGFRWYMPEIGRFVSSDPIADKFPELTNYQYAGNTPIQAIDLDGLEPITINLEMTMWENIQTYLISAWTSAEDIKAIAQMGTPQGQYKAMSNLYDLGVRVIENPKAVFDSGASQIYKIIIDTNSTDPLTAGKAKGHINTFIIELVVGSKGVSTLGKTSTIARTTSVVDDVVEEFMIFYRGDANGSPIITSHAVKKGGYAYSKSLIENGDLETLMKKHAAHSEASVSPFISITTDIGIARHFAGPNGTIHVLRIPKSRAIPNIYNKYSVEGVSESEYLIPNYIRPSEIITSVKLNP